MRKYTRLPTLILLGVIAGMLILELILRITHVNSVPKRTLIYYTIPSLRGPVRITDFGYEYIPNGNEWADSSRMRAIKDPIHKNAGTYRILLLGDSTSTNERETNWEPLLGNMLKRFGDFEILNAALPGFNLPNYCGYLKEKGMGYNPDLVLVAFCLNDCENWSFIFNNGHIHMIGTKEIFNNKLFLSPLLFRHSYLYRYFFFNLPNYDKQFLSPGETERMLNDMKEASKGRIVATIFPLFKELKNYSVKEKYEYDLLKTSLRNSGIDYLDLSGYYGKFGKDIASFRNSPEDLIHFNQKAHNLNAQAIYPWLCREINKYRAVR